MAIDFGEKEREFLATLEADTGRSLDAWMAAITAGGFTDKNDVIDWLRRQGFLFARASWLERIHNNGGRPIYAEAPSPATRPAEPDAGPAMPVSPPADATPPAPAVTATFKPVADTGALETLLAEAKAYRPLATYVLKEIERAVPGLICEARSGLALLQLPDGRAFAALAVSAKELRLAADFKGSKPSPPWQSARMAKPWPALPDNLGHMVKLTDARQITDDLIAAIRTAAS